MFGHRAQAQCIETVEGILMQNFHVLFRR
jgi:hypothetical protein